MGARCCCDGSHRPTQSMYHPTSMYGVQYMDVLYIWKWGKQSQRGHLLALGCKARNWWSHDLTEDELCGIAVGDTKRSGVLGGTGSARLRKNTQPVEDIGTCISPHTWHPRGRLIWRCSFKVETYLTTWGRLQRAFSHGT